MKVLNHLLFLVAATITGRADVIPERTRRDDNQVPVGGKVRAYYSSSVNPNTDAQLSAEIGEGGAFIDYSLRTPNGVGGLNEVGESFGAEGKAVAAYDGEGQFNAGNIVDEHGLAPPSAGFGYGNQFKTAAQASASAKVYTGETAANGGTAPADITTQAKLQAQFEQGVQHVAETQADAIIQEKQGVQHDKGTKVQTTYQSIMPFNELMNSGPPDLAGPIKYLWLNSYGPGYVESLNNPNRGNRPISVFTTPPPQADTDPYYNQPPSVPINDTGIEQFKPMANIYTGEWITQSPNWIKKGLLYNNVDWNIYTKPAQTLVQMDRKIEPDVLAQENGEPQYQKQNQAKSMVQTNNGVDVTAVNADAEAKTNAGYGGQYNAESQPGVMAQINSESQYDTSALADKVVQSSGGVQYSGENKLTSSAQANARIKTNVASSYSGGLQHNGGAHYVGGYGTKGAAQTSEGIKYGAKHSENALNADTGKYNGGSLNGEGFQANAKSHLQSGVQFGGAVGAEAIAQPGIVVETRFGQSTHPPRRPIPGFGYRHPYSVWNHG